MISANVLMQAELGEAQVGGVLSAKARKAISLNVIVHIPSTSPPNSCILTCLAHSTAPSHEFHN